ncbi:MAG: efflux RND transporter permease subunit, partial [Myxococcota bacterium]
MHKSGGDGGDGGDGGGDDASGKKARKFGGFLSWMTRNAVAANILMLVLLVGGGIRSCELKQEVFPEFDIDSILVNLPYPGASPEEIEQGVILSVEEEVRGLNGVKQVTAFANEGVGGVYVELLLGEDPNQMLNDVKAAVDRIQSFPEDMERPIVSRARFSNQVITVAFYGDQDPQVLKAVVERARDALLQDPRITTVSMTGLPALEISIEVSQENLRRYGFTVDQLAAIVRSASVELPGGAVRTRGGEILLRTTERRDAGPEFGDIIVRSNPDGSVLYLRDIADIKDGFAETDQIALFNGKRAVMLNVFRVGDQTPIDVSAAVHEYIAENESTLPPGVQIDTWRDTSEWYDQRMGLLVKNALIGLALVLIVLGLFLEVKLAFWVTMGIPISFIGSLVFLPNVDMSINMISLFAFIVVLGMVVDDAIIVGEAIYRVRQSGAKRLEAAITGAKEVAAPVTFAIITSVVAFSPMLFIPGVMGKFFRLIPIVVIAVLLMSLVESLLILPAHLAHSSPSQRGFFGLIHRQQQRFSRFLERQIDNLYIPVVRAVARRYYLTLAIGWAILFSVCGTVAGGRVAQEVFPDVEGDEILVFAEMPFGTAIEVTEKVQSHLLNTALEILEENGGADVVSRGTFSNLGANGAIRNDPNRLETTGTHLTEIGVYLVPLDERDFTTEEFVREWRERVGEIPGLDRISYEYGTGPGQGAPLDLILSHRELEPLRAAASELAAAIGEFSGTFDINDGFENGKEQLDLTLKPEARALGLTEIELARQIRSASFGAQAVRQQRGREELRVYVRLPRAERESEYNIEELIIRVA